MKKKEFKPLDLTNHASQVLRKFFRQEDGDKTNYTATDLYEVLEMSENKFKQQIQEAVQGLLKEMEEIKLSNKTLLDLHYEIKQLIKKYFPDEVKENE